jgi:TonB family protein
MREFRVEIFELSNEKKTSLLDTEVILPARNIAVFGFEDMQQKPYFLALRVPQAGILGGVAGGVKGGVLGGVEGGVAGAANEIKTPRLIKKVDPVYPEIARQAGVEGYVILEVETDTNGRVQDARILRSIPILNQAAIDAVKQWVYEPLVIDGIPKPAIYTVTVRFSLDGEKAAKSSRAIEEFTRGAVKITGDMEPPQLIRRVDPIYPEIARQAHVEGVVILQARTDTSGKVKEVMVLRSVPLLDQAAIDAVSQWVYEPMIIKGKPMEAVFTVTVRFGLKDKEKKAALKKTSELEKGAVRATGEINPPRLIKKIEPIYPEEARKAGIEGIVILEAMTDEKGNVARVKVLKSIPELDQAAINSLKQWKYEPTIIDGKPTPIVFTVTVNFKLK